MLYEALTGITNPIILRKWSNKAPYVTGVDIITSDVYNLAYGQIVYIGQYEGHYLVDIKSNNNEVLRYCNLNYVNVQPASYIREGTKIGTAQKYVHIEYVTSWRGDSVFPVRINDLTYYKQDPQDVLDGVYTVVPTATLDYAAHDKLNPVEYTEEQKAEFTGGKW